MGFLSKVFKGVKKVFKKVGSGIKKAVKKVGKVAGKLGIVGQIGLMFVLPGIGGALAKGFGMMTQGLINAGGLATGIGNVLATAGKFASTVGNVFSSVTEGITSFVGKVGGKVLEKVGLKAATEGTVTEAFQSWMSDTATGFGEILDPFKMSNKEFVSSLIPKPTTATASMTAEKTSIAETSATKAAEKASGALEHTAATPTPFDYNTDMTTIDEIVRKEAADAVSQDIIQEASGSTLSNFINQDIDFLGKQFNIADTARNQILNMGQQALFGREEVEDVARQVAPRYLDPATINATQDLYQQNGVYIGATPVNRVADVYGQSLQAGLQYISPLRGGRR